MLSLRQIPPSHLGAFPPFRSAPSQTERRQMSWSERKVCHTPLDGHQEELQRCGLGGYRRDKMTEPSTLKYAMSERRRKLAMGSMYLFFTYL